MSMISSTDCCRYESAGREVSRRGGRHGWNRRPTAAAAIPATESAPGSVLAVAQSHERELAFTSRVFDWALHFPLPMLRVAHLEAPDDRRRTTDQREDGNGLLHRALPVCRRPVFGERRTSGRSRRAGSDEDSRQALGKATSWQRFDRSCARRAGRRRRTPVPALEIRGETAPSRCFVP